MDDREQRGRSRTAGHPCFRLEAEAAAPTARAHARDGRGGRGRAGPARDSCSARPGGDRVPRSFGLPLRPTRFRLNLEHVSSAWFGLIGVVVGGLISTAWGWIAAIRMELSEAVVAARLVDAQLRRFENSSATPPDRHSLEFHPETWANNRPALARVLGRHQWDVVAEACDGLAQPSVEEDESLRAIVHEARDALDPLVSGKRHVMQQRLGNLSRKRR